MKNENMNLYQKLIEVRKSVPYLQKENNTNKGNDKFGYSYVSSSQTLASVRMKMDELGIILEPEIINAIITQTKSSSGATNFFTELTMTMTFVNADKPEEKIIKQWYAQGVDTGEKGVGKALTYGEKYFILKYFNIATDKDDPDSFQDKTDKTEKTAKKAPVPTPEKTQSNPISESNKKIMKSLINKHLTIKQLEEITGFNGKSKPNTDIDSYSDKQLMFIYGLAKKEKEKKEISGGLPL
jgi:hypothetical protein